MTCIIGIECTDGAILAGDFLGSNGFTKTLVTQSKIFNHSNILYGCTSTFRFGQILECLLDDKTLYVPSDPDETYGWLIKNFIPKLKSTLKEAEYGGSNNAILVINRQVWELQDDFSVLRASNGVNSVGSGVYHAIASISTQIKLTKQPTINEAIKMLELTYSVVSECTCGVSEQFNYLVQQ